MATLQYPAGEESRLTFAQRYESLTEWLENLRILPLVLVISGVHYSNVLWEHDGPILAILVAIILDVTHFGSLKQVVTATTWKSRLGWGFGSVLLTAWAFALQYQFYADGWELKLDAVIYAGLIPLLMVITAFREAKHINLTPFKADSINQTGVNPQEVPLLNSFDGVKALILNQLTAGNTGLSRNKMAKAIGKTTPTVSNHVRELLALGVVVEENGLDLAPVYKGV